MYMDTSLGQTLAVDIYDCNLKLWKVFSIGLSRGDHANYSLQSFGGSLSYLIRDVQNDHASYLSTFGPNYKGGLAFKFDSEVLDHYRDFTRYSSAAGMSQIME